LRSYVDSILAAGFELIKVLGPWDSVINAFPLVRSEAELEDYPRRALTQRLGRLGGALARVPFITSLTWAYLNRPTPGRFYSFIAARPKTVS
jgi:hypothetical protein